MSDRLADRFRKIAAEGRAGLVTYVMASDPDDATCLDILKALPGAGADVIELGFPFSDPMADGPSIQRAGLRSLKAGGSLRATLEIARRFREGDQETPLVLMGYANPVEQFGAERFARAAREAGVDGAIIVDLPPEEDTPVREALAREAVALVRLATPTTVGPRLTRVLDGAGGFLYYVSMTGVTGAKAVDTAAVAAALAPLRAATHLPIAVGFGVREADQAREIAALADAVVVGSAIVDAIAGAVAEGALPVEAARRKVEALAEAVRQAPKRRGEAA